MTRFVKYNTQGAIVAIGDLPDSLVKLQGDLVLPISDTEVTINSHYIDIASKVLVHCGVKPSQNHLFDYTLKQWIDPRTSLQISTDVILAIQVARSNAYPPLTDLADALYWQAHGDESKMITYLAACEEVKLRFPMPIIEG